MQSVNWAVNYGANDWKTQQLYDWYNVCDNCYPHIHLLPTYPHLASADFIRLLPAATSADPHICLLPIAIKFKSVEVSDYTLRYVYVIV